MRSWTQAERQPGWVDARNVGLVLLAIGAVLGTVALGMYLSNHSTEAERLLMPIVAMTGLGALYLVGGEIAGQRQREFTPPYWHFEVALIGFIAGAAFAGGSVYYKADQIFDYGEPVALLPVVGVALMLICTARMVQSVYARA